MQGKKVMPAMHAISGIRLERLIDKTVYKMCQQAGN
jgi:hypothetical protein